MHLDKWKDTLLMVKTKFRVLSEGREEMTGIPGAFLEFIEFSGPQGKTRLEYTTQPAVIDKKTTYSKTSGSASNVEYIYDPNEVVHRLKAMQFNEARGEWEELRAPLG